MARSVAWRRTVSDAASWHQDEASSATIYILREMGPTGFLLKEDGEQKYLKVFIGDLHSCTCPVFKKEKDLCKHICWVLLKKFRVPRQNPISWQLGLVEREITDLVRGIAASQPVKPSVAARRMAAMLDRNQEESSTGGGSGASEASTVPQRDISSEDVCPICQDELLSRHQPVTYCRFGCGNNVHIKCMKVWAEHQKTTGKAFIECPFCRENFGPLSLLQVEYQNAAGADARAERLHEHPGIVCSGCHVMPISGKCYKCSVCTDVYLCQSCFNTETHKEHGFQYRLKMSQKWRPAPSRGSTVLPAAVISSLLARDISEQDYELLLQLDNPSAQQPSSLTEATIRSFPLESIRQNSVLLAPGQQCCVCLRGYAQGQQVRRLPCRHCFHRDCIDDWLLNQHPTCPVDGAVYTNESVRQIKEAERLRKQRLLSRTNPKEDQQNSRGLKPSTRSQETLNLEIPGVGLTRHVAPSGTDERDHTGGVLNVSANSSNVLDNSSATYFQRSTLHNRNSLPRNRTGSEFLGNDPVLEVTSAPSSTSADVTGSEQNVPYCHGNDHSVQNHHGNEQNVPTHHGNEHIEPSRHGNKQMVHHRHGNQRQRSNLSDFDLRHFGYSRETSQGETDHISTYNRSLSVENVFGHQGTLVGNRSEHDRKLYRNNPAQENPNSNHTINQRILQMNNMLCTPADILSLLSSATSTSHRISVPAEIKMPLPPSIPVPRTMTDGHLEVTGVTQGTSLMLEPGLHRPPLGPVRSAGSAKSRYKGRLRLQPLFGDTCRRKNHNKITNAPSGDGNSESERPSDPSELFIGNDPSFPSELTAEVFVQRPLPSLPLNHHHQHQRSSLYRHRSTSLSRPTEMTVNGSSVPEVFTENRKTKERHDPTQEDAPINCALYIRGHRTWIGLTYKATAELSCQHQSSSTFSQVH